MFNMFKVRKFVGILFAILLSVVSFYVGLTFYGLIIAMICVFVSAIVGYLFASIMIKNPFTDMIEGNGMLALDINSTGVIRPFNIQVKPPYITSKMGQKTIEDVFDRKMVMQLTTMIKEKKLAERVTIDGKKRTVFCLDDDQLNNSRFVMYSYPVLIWNEQIGSLINKEMISGVEQNVFINHVALYLNHKVQELTSVMRDFARYIAEQTKPRKSIMSGGTFAIVIIIIAVIILAMLFAPQVIKTLQGSAGNIGSALSNANSAVVPK